MVKEEKSKKFRLNLEFSPQVQQRLLSLKARSDCASVTEVIRRSVALFDLYLDQAEDGGEIVFRNRDGSEKELKIL